MADISYQFAGTAPTYGGPDVGTLDWKNSIAITAIDFAAKFTVSEGTAAYTLLDPASSPLSISGISLDGSTGLLTGTPTVNGVYSFKVRCTVTYSNASTYYAESAV